MEELAKDLQETIEPELVHLLAACFRGKGFFVAELREPGSGEHPVQVPQLAVCRGRERLNLYTASGRYTDFGAPPLPETFSGRAFSLQQDADCRQIVLFVR